MWCSEERFVCAAERRRGVGASLPVISCGDKRTLCKTHKFYSILISFILFFCSVPFRFGSSFFICCSLSLFLFTRTHAKKAPPPPTHPFKLIQFLEEGERGLGKKCKQLQLRVLVMSLTMPAS